MQIEIACLGSFQVTLDGVPVKFATDHVRALLAYVAVEARPHERTTLAALLWPEQAETAARQNLRQALLYLKQALRAIPQLERLLVITSRTVHFQAQTVTMDVQQFRQHWASYADQSSPTLGVNITDISHLQQAATLYRGEFLQGIFVKNSQLFEEWALYGREQLHRQALEVLQKLTAYYALAGDYRQMQQTAARQLEMEPWREEAHQQMMQALALSGQLTAALTHYAVCQRVLADELGVSPAPETTALYEQIRAGKTPRVAAGHSDQSQAYQPVNSTAELPRPVTVAMPHNLPAAATPFVGRERELAELTTRLQEPGVRLLTLLGPGGMGKTRLALETAKTMVNLNLRHYTDGVFFVALAPLSDPAALAPQIATTLGLPLSGDPRTFLLHALHHKQLLLLLDNFEQLLPTALAATSTQADTTAVDLVAELLSTAPGVQILVTARERLNLRGEYLYAVGGLPFAPLSSVATDSAALRLFVQSAQRHDASFQLDAAKLPALLRICQLVEGMPLGLEMAAAQADQLSLAEIAGALEQDVDFLALTWHDLPPRQRSMRAVFEWSWRLLPAEERRVLRQLAVFRGGFTRTAAVTIADAALPVLTSLVYKSLLRRTVREDGESRYDLHELLRQFAAAVLQETPAEAAAVAARHSAFYLNLVAAQEHRLARDEPDRAATAIQQDLDNVRQAWAWAAQHGDYATLAASAYSLWQFYLLVGLHAEGIRAFQVAVKGVQTTQAPGWQSLLSQLLAIKAYLLGSQGAYDEALTIAQQAVNLATTCDSRAGEIIGRISIFQSLYYRGQLAEARVYAEQLWQRVAEQPADIRQGEFEHDGAFGAQLYLGAIAQSTDNYDAARGHFTQGLQLCQPLGKLRGAIHAQMNLANLERYLGNYGAARQSYEQVLRLASQLNYRWGAGVTQYELADVLRGQGEYSLALAMFDDALAILREINEPMREVYATAELSRLYSYLGDYPQALAFLQQAQALTEEATLSDARHVRLAAAAVFHYQTGHYSAALQAATACQQTAHADGSRRMIGIAAIYQGFALEALGEWRSAQEAYTSAINLVQQLAPRMAEAHAGLARVALAQRELTAAQTQVEAILPILADYPYIGLDEPFAIYLTCYRVLAAAQDARATALLQRGYKLLQQYAAQITNNEHRRRFLENVAIHRELQHTFDLANR